MNLPGAISAGRRASCKPRGRCVAENIPRSETAQPVGAPQKGTRGEERSSQKLWTPPGTTPFQKVMLLTLLGTQAARG
jgi:hypothetical protein